MGHNLSYPFIGPLKRKKTAQKIGQISFTGHQKDRLLTYLMDYPK